MPGAVIAMGRPGVGESGITPGEEKKIMWAVDAHLGPVARVNQEDSGPHKATSSQHTTCLKRGNGSHQHSFNVSTLLDASLLFLYLYSGCSRQIYVKLWTLWLIKFSAGIVLLPKEPKDLLFLSVMLTALVYHQFKYEFN